jgi:integrase
MCDDTRPRIELYARQLEELGRVPARIGRCLSTLAGFYRYAAEKGGIEPGRARPSTSSGLRIPTMFCRLDRKELDAFLVQAGLSSVRDHALCSLLALNGRRISEALGANIECPAPTSNARTDRGSRGTAFTGDNRATSNRENHSRRQALRTTLAGDIRSSRLHAKTRCDFTHEWRHTLDGVPPSVDEPG